MFKTSEQARLVQGDHITTYVGEGPTASGGARIDINGGVRHAKQTQRHAHGPNYKNRNNTNFPLEVLEWFRNLPEPGRYDFLKYYQYMTMSFATQVDTGAKGLLINHDMGLGKTLLAVAIGVEFIERGLKVVILLTKSLQANMRDTIKQYIKMRKVTDPEWPIGLIAEPELDAYINANFSFVSMNASNMLQQMQQAASVDLDGIDAALEEKLGNIASMSTLNDHVLIVDEAHNLFRAITNGSKNAMGVYDLVMKSPRCKFFPLSGTPIASDPFEMVPCFNMLSGDPNLLPNNYADFRRYFISEDGKTVKNTEVLKNRIMGLVSRVTAESRPGAAIRATHAELDAMFDIPEEYPMKVERVHMDDAQFAAYVMAREAEMAEGKSSGSSNWRGRIQDRAPPRSSPMNKPRSSMSSTYRAKSRRFSDYVKGTRSPKFEAILRNIDAHGKTLGLVYSEFVNESGLQPFADFLVENGWEELKVDVKKGAAMPQPNVSYAPESEGTIWGGDEWGADDESPTDDASPVDAKPTQKRKEPTPSTLPKRKFAIYSGNVDVDTRLMLTNIYNSPANAHGENLALLLISATGAEGLDLKRGRHVHIMEPYWNNGRVRQIILRIKRNGSHADLPPEEKNVQAYIYLAIPPRGHEEASPTTDEELYSEAVADAVLLQNMVSLYDTVSIECSANGCENCKVCNPTNRPLYSSDIYRDINGPDPCTSVVEKRVTAVEIEIDGAKYYYAPNANSPFGYSVWYYDEKVRAFMPLRQDNPAFMAIINSLAGSDNA